MIRSPSTTGDNGSTILEDLPYDNRGREPTVHPDRLTHIGRGGAGNIRSPSRDPAQADPTQGAAVSYLLATQLDQFTLQRRMSAASSRRARRTGLLPPGAGAWATLRARPLATLVSLARRGREVEDVELPERAGVVHGRRGQRRQVVLHGLVRLGRRGGGVQVGEDHVVVQVHRGPHPPRLGALFHVILHLQQCLMD